MKTLLFTLKGTCLLSLFILTACNSDPKKADVATLTDDPHVTDSTDTISLDSAKTLTSNWRTRSNIDDCNKEGDQFISHFFFASELERLLADGHGIRAYFYLTDATSDSLHLVLMSTLDNGQDDISQQPDNFARPCPSICDCSSALAGAKISNSVNFTLPIVSPVDTTTAKIWTQAYRTKNGISNGCSVNASPKIKGYWISHDAIVNALSSNSSVNGIRFYFGSPGTQNTDPIYLIVAPALLDTTSQRNRDYLGNSLYLASDVCPDSIYCSSPLAR